MYFYHDTVFHFGVLDLGHYFNLFLFMVINHQPHLRHPSGLEKACSLEKACGLEKAYHSAHYILIEIKKAMMNIEYAALF